MFNANVLVFEGLNNGLKILLVIAIGRPSHKSTSRLEVAYKHYPPLRASLVL